MSGADLLSYLGASTGVAGLALSIITLVRTEKVRTVERSVVVGKALATLNHRIAALPELLCTAKVSYERLAAAEGRLHSGATQAWMNQWSADEGNAQTFVDAADGQEIDLEGLGFSELAQFEVTIHKISQEVDLIEGRYRASLASDERGVERRKQEFAALSASYMRGGSVPQTWPSASEK